MGHRPKLAPLARKADPFEARVVTATAKPDATGVIGTSPASAGNGGSRKRTTTGRARGSDLLVTLFVVLLLFIGFFKGSDLLSRSPVDLTLVCMGAVFILVTVRVLTSRGQVIISPWAAVLVSVCIPGAFYPLTNPEAFDKRLRLLIPILGAIGVCYLVGSAARQRIWVWLHVAVGVTLVATGASVDDDAATRFAGAASNTIGAGRASGVAIVVLLVLLTTGGLRRWWMKIATLAVVAWLTVALISTGSRGPVFACAAAVLIVATLSLGGHRILRLLTAICATGAGWLMLTSATGLGATRISSSVTGQDALTRGRSQLWTAAYDQASRHPLGIGWGNFWSVLPPAERLDSGYIQYPHNFVLEMFTEAGWLAGAAALIFVILSLNRLRRVAHQPYGSALLGIAIFFVINGLVSGDVNDNRTMWAALAMAWVVSLPPRQLPRNPSIPTSGTGRLTQPGSAQRQAGPPTPTGSGDRKPGAL